MGQKTKNRLPAVRAIDACLSPKASCSVREQGLRRPASCRAFRQMLCSASPASMVPLLATSAAVAIIRQQSVFHCMPRACMRDLGQIGSCSVTTNRRVWFQNQVCSVPRLEGGIVWSVDKGRRNKGRSLGGNAYCYRPGSVPVSDGPRTTGTVQRLGEERSRMAGRRPRQEAPRKRRTRRARGGEQRYWVEAELRA